MKSHCRPLIVLYPLSLYTTECKKQAKHQSLHKKTGISLSDFSARLRRAGSTLSLPILLSDLAIL